MLRSARSAPAPQGLRQIVWAAVLGCALATPLAALAQGKVYVSSEKDNKIYVFDAKGERLSAIDTCERPRHMMLQPARSGGHGHRQDDRDCSIGGQSGDF